MAHHINFNEQTGRDSFFSVKEKAWHGLGKIVQDYPTSAEAMEFAGLDFTVEKRKLFICENESGDEDSGTGTGIPGIEVPGQFATLRTDTGQPLGVVGSDYKIVQNRDAFAFFDAIVGGQIAGQDGGIHYETAGALGKGERIFITAKLPDTIRVGREDLIEQYIYLTTSHDGFGSIMAAFTPVRIVCANTLNAALSNCSNMVKIRHTANAKERLQQAHRVMGISRKISGELQNVFNSWAKVRVTDPEIRRLIQLAMVPNKEVYQHIREGKLDELSTCFKNICNTVYEYAMSSPDQQTETTRGTLFGVLNAVTGYHQNVRHYKSAETKLESILYGGIAQQRMQRCFNLCSDFRAGDLGEFFNPCPDFEQVPARNQN